MRNACADSPAPASKHIMFDDILDHAEWNSKTCPPSAPASKGLKKNKKGCYLAGIIRAEEACREASLCMRRHALRRSLPRQLTRHALHGMDLSTHHRLQEAAIQWLDRLALLDLPWKDASRVRADLGTAA